MRPVLPLAVAAFLLFAGSARAATVPDQVLAEVSAPMDVGIDGPVVAYTRRIGVRGVELVVHDGAKPARRLGAGVISSPVDVGRKRGGGRVVGYTRCKPGGCDVVAYDVAKRRSRVLATKTRTSDVTVGGNRIFWTAGKQVRSRSLDGGAVRREGVAEDLDPEDLDTDGTTLAVTGDFPSDEDDTTESNGLSVTRVGSGRPRLRGAISYAEEYRGVRSPVVTPKGVTGLYDEFYSGASTALADYAAGKRAFTKRSTGGMTVLEWDRDAKRAVFLEGPTAVGCAVGNAFLEIVLARAPCRIVVATVGGDRRLPPHVSVRRETARVEEPTLTAAGAIRARGPLAGVAVELRSEGGKLVRTLTTDAQGRVTLPDAADIEPVVVKALTVPPSFGCYLCDQ